MSLHCDLDLEGGKTIFPQDKMPHDDASSYYIWLQNVKQFRRCHHCALGLGSKMIFSQNSQAYGDVPSNEA